MSITGSQFLLNNRRYIVTGAASGIGKEYCHRAFTNWSILVVGRY